VMSHSLPENRMPGERCTSGLARGHANPLISRPDDRAHLTQPYIPMTRGFVYPFVVMDGSSRRPLSRRQTDADPFVNAFSQERTV